MRCQRHQSLRHQCLVCCCMLLISSAAFAGGIQVVGDLTQAYTVRVGQSVEGSIILQNGSNNPHEVRIYQTDYLFFCDGKNIYGDPGSVPRSNCKWITFSPQQTIIPPGDFLPVYYTIQVPNNDDLSGTYWSMLMVEPLGEALPEPEQSKLEEATIGIKTVMRYAIQMVTNVEQTGKKEISIIDKRLVDLEGAHVLQLDIENKGERWLRPSIRAELYDEQGTYAGSFDGGAVRIYPGCSVRRRIRLEEVGAGRYTVLVIVDNGDEAVWGAQYELAIEQT